MSKFVLYVKESGLIIQWQDYDEFNYAEPDLEYSYTNQVSDLEWEEQEVFTHVINGELVNYTEPTIENPPVSNETIKESRRIAYADPINGSDYYYIRAMSLQASGFSYDSVEVKDSLAAAAARKLEIQNIYPYTV